MDELHEISITFASGFIAEILDVTGPSRSRGNYETSYKGQTSRGRTFNPTHLYDPGGVRITMGYDPSASVPIDSDPESITIDWGDSAGHTSAAEGFLTDFESRAPMDDKATADVTLKLSGEITDA